MAARRAANGGENRGGRVGVVSRFHKAWGDSPFYQSRLNGPAPDRFAFNPIDPYTPERSIAEGLATGRLSIGEEKIDCNGNLENFWALAAPGGPAEHFLDEFSWLRPLSSLGRAAILPAQSIARVWFDENEKWSPDAWTPFKTSERLINLCCYGRLVIGDGDALWRSRVLSSMARQTRHLAQSGHRAGTEYARLMTAIGLTLSALCLPGCEPAIEKGIEQLRRELRLQVRADGGHINRNPSRQLELVVRLQMVLAALEVRKIEPPGFLRHILRRAAAHLQMFRVGDGRLAIFNGSIEGDSRALIAVANAIDSDLEPAGFARHSGFQRMESSRAVVIADTGVGRSTNLRKTDYKSASSFHFSSGRSRIVVNCGGGAHLGDDWRIATYTAAAQSTLSFAAIDAANGALEVLKCTHRRAEDACGQLLEIERAFGEAPNAASHCRRLFLSSDGANLRGEDSLFRLDERWAQSWHLRFHLHPGVRASMARDGKSVILALPNREGWRFRSNYRGVSVEKSVYLGEGGAPQAAEQIVLSAPQVKDLEVAAPEDIVVKWSFQRMDGV